MPATYLKFLFSMCFIPSLKYFQSLKGEPSLSILREKIQIISPKFIRSVRGAFEKVDIDCKYLQTFTGIYRGI